MLQLLLSKYDERFWEELGKARKAMEESEERGRRQSRSRRTNST
jgi:hypothetical protein